MGGILYDYRRMTPAERKEAVEYRRTQGFPLHKPPHLDFGPGWYSLTAATFEHIQHFSNARELSAIEFHLLKNLRQCECQLGGWVVLPNHYHALIHTFRLAGAGKALGLLHGRSSHYANRRDGTQGRRVWYKFNDRQIRSERHFWTCLHYMIFNPVKHGYVDQMEHWAWSCVHELAAERGKPWVEDLCREFPLLEFGKDWDF